MDAGYVDAEQIHHARRDHSITLVGPVGKNTNRQQATGDFFDSTRFTIDWDQRRAVCPGGHTSVQWRDAQSHRGTPVTRVRFAERHCGPCDLRTSCTNAGTGRNLTLRPKVEHEILQQARTEQDTDHWRRGYGHRAGVEGTISQDVQAFGLRRSRYRGLAKTRLQHHFTGAAINLDPHRCPAHRQTPRPHPHLTHRSNPPRWMRPSGADLPTASASRSGPTMFPFHPSAEAATSAAACRSAWRQAMIAGCRVRPRRTAVKTRRARRPRGSCRSATVGGAPFHTRLGSRVAATAARVPRCLSSRSRRSRCRSNTGFPLSSLCRARLP